MEPRTGPRAGGAIGPAIFRELLIGLSAAVQNERLRLLDKPGQNG